MAELTIDMTYAKGLFLAAKQRNKEEEILEELASISDLFHQETAFFGFICSPVISGFEKKKVVRNVLKDRITDEMVNFLLILIDKGRGRHFDKIRVQYIKLFNESQGYTTGMIYSVSPLSKDQIQGFEEKTGTLLGKEVKLFNKTDVSLLGGVRIFVDGKLIDSSVKKRLEDLMETLGHQMYA
jgi:ATP synthase F1 delta subunit